MAYSYQLWIPSQYGANDPDWILCGEFAREIDAEEAAQKMNYEIYDIIRVYR